MCLVLIIRMQSAVRASLLRMASLSSSPSWASIDMGRKARPKTSVPQRPPCEPRSRGQPKAEGPVLYFLGVARRALGAPIAKSTRHTGSPPHAAAQGIGVSFGGHALHAGG